MGKEGVEHRDWAVRRCCGACAATILTLIVLVGFIVLVVFLVLQPTKPEFYLQDVQLHSLALTDPAISTTFQVTVASRNPNARVGVYYDTLEIYATYRDEPITVYTGLPQSYEGYKEVSVWSPVLSGSAVPVAPYVADALRQDCSAGYVLLYIQVNGAVRWKVGSWTSGTYKLFVKCPALLSAKSGNGLANITGVPTTSFEFGQAVKCNVDA